MTARAETPVEPSAERAKSTPTSERPLVRAVGGVPLPLRAKLLIGFGVVGVLLAIGYVLGFVALGQSNSRSDRLRSLQQTAASAQLLEADAAQLVGQVAARGDSTNTDAAVSNTQDEAANTAWQQFYADVATARASSPLRTTNPLFLSRLQARLDAFQRSWGKVVANDGTTLDPTTSLPNVNRAAAIASHAEAQARQLENRTTAQANTLVTADHSSFASSRDLLIGVGAASLALAVLLGLLISESVVGPLRRTEDRLGEIAEGDFTGRLEIVNRDEIGTLATKVNSTSDELQRVHRELETASEHKSQFLTNMSHELRTPLNAIIGFSEVLHEQMFGELNERQLAYVNDVLAAGKHLLSLINDVLDLAKIEAGRMDLELSQVDIPSVLRSAVSLHSERAGRDGIALALTTEPEEITITADERRVRQIAFNLVSNAVKFTPAGGSVDVSASVEDGRVEIGVSDTGPGIAATDREMIFEEFEQTTDGKKAEGTGLGLPLSRRLVELHGGRLWVESEVGHGSTFRFTLPVHHEIEAT
jgi:signal transduction histidine kinase